MQRNTTAAKLGNQFIATALAVILLIGTTGCETARDFSLTRKLWSPEADFEGSEYHPAANSGVQLYESVNPPDILVQYNEAKDNSKTVTRRAYFLLENRSRTDTNRKPRFVSSDSAENLLPIPLLAAAEPVTATPPQLYAVIRSNDNQLTLHGEHWDEGPYTLPHYSTSHPTTSRVVLTPFAVAGDVVMVGLAAGFVGAILWISAGAPMGNCR